MGILSDEEADDIVSMLESSGLPTKTDFAAEDLYNAALGDKKASGADITIVVPEKIGVCRLIKMPKEELKSWIAAGL